MENDKITKDQNIHYLPNGERLKPLVFKAQASDIEVLPHDKLIEWEENVKTWASLAVLPIEKGGLGGSCGFTISGSPRAADDSIRD